MSLDDLRIKRRADKRTLAADLAAAVADVLVESTDGAGVAHVSLTGGSMGEALLAALPKAADGRPIAWDRVHVWWSDERFVPADDEDRNDRPALPVLRRLGLPNGNVHPMPAQGQVPDLAAAMIAVADRLAAAAAPEPDRVWHAPTGPALTQAQLARHFADAAGVPLPKISGIPTPLLRAIGLFSPTMRELAEVAYQFEAPFILDASRSERELGLAPTPIEEAASETVAWWRTQAS